MEHFCYIIYSKSTGRTYNGYTNHLSRRIRQHNQEIKGGARATKRASDWEYACWITCPDWDRVDALKFEWQVKYPARQRPRPKCFEKVQGRIASLATIFADPRYHAQQFHVYIPEDLQHFLPPLPDFVKTEVVPSLLVHGSDADTSLAEILQGRFGGPDVATHTMEEE